MDLRGRFGLHAVPFTPELAVEQQFRLPFLDEAHDGLRSCVDQRMCGAFVAPAGSGKSQVLRRLIDDLAEARYHVTYIKVAGLSKRDMCREIARACGAEPAGSYPVLVARLQERFDQAYSVEGRRPVVVIDEAHDLRPDVLAMLRLLANFDVDSRLVVSFLLAGQPPLRATLAREDQEAIARRLARIVSLRLLSRDEAAAYVEHRCTVAGAVNLPFDRPAVEALYELSLGNMRAIDRLALEALLVCDRQAESVVNVGHVTAARRNVFP